MHTPTPGRATVKERIFHVRPLPEGGDPGTKTEPVYAVPNTRTAFPTEVKTRLVSSKQDHNVIKKKIKIKLHKKMWFNKHTNILPSPFKVENNRACVEVRNRLP